MNNEIKYLPAVGLDVGTMNLVAARQTADGDQVETKRIRDAFLDLDLEAKKTLRLTKVDYVEKDGTLIVLGDNALTMANLFKREVRRPLSRGVISAGELDAQQILSLLVSHVVGNPVTPNEHCYYSVPAAPVDDENQDITYHQEVFRKILTELGYNAVSYTHLTLPTM
jgi:actin-like ATPase involved in cell morphogenesis